MLLQLMNAWCPTPTHTATDECMVPYWGSGGGFLPWRWFVPVYVTLGMQFLFLVWSLYSLSFWVGGGHVTVTFPSCFDRQFQSPPVSPHTH